MAERWAVATGNWSSTSTWNGGTLPAVDDDVYANGFTVTINQNVTVLSLRTTAGTNAVAGGVFSVSTGSITINAPSIIAGTGQQCINCTASGGVTVINGNIQGSDTATSIGLYVTNNNPQVTINGNVTSGSFAASYGVRLGGAGSITINGNVTAVGAIGAWNTNATGTLTINGNSIAGSFPGSSNNTTGTLIVNGNAIGGTAPNAHGVVNISTGNVTVTGNAKGGTGTTSRGVSNNSTGTVNVLGLAIGSDTTGGVGVFNASTGLVTIGGAQFGAQGWPPYSGIIHYNNLDSASLTIERSDFTTRTLQSGSFIPNYSMNGGFRE